MGTGVGEAALIGAAVGGGTALLTGNDPLRGALLGGVTGGAGSKLNTMFNTAAPTAVPTATSTATSTGTNLADALKAVEVTPVKIGEGIAGAAPGSTAFWQGTNAVPQTAQNLSGGIAGPGINLAKNQYTTGLNFQPQVADAARNLGTTAQQTTQPGFFGNIMDEYRNLGTMGKIGVGIGGGVALNALAGGMKQPGIETAEEEENPFGLATYNREKYKSINPMQHNVYRPVYGAEGGVMQSYAQGGIAALAAGGMGNNTGYPMGQMDMTQYASPTQMPTSAQVVNADYEQKTDPYRGTPIGMAEGGEVKRMFMGGIGGRGQQVFYDPVSGEYYTQQGYNGFNSMFGLNRLTNKKPAEADAYKAYQAYQDETASPKVYEPGYQDYVEGTPMVTTPEAFDQSPSFIDAYNLLVATSPNIASTISPEALVAATGVPATSGTTGTAGGMAQGGIAGYNLGGYASGGNPRLLKGPGDGMSDNIPAIIGGRQPARLADGEFVVPADVVSHLGNGSTDAGAKHLYSMMDKVRKARTGNKKQGKQIKPGKFLPA